MPICSLVPGATEVVAALDLTDQLVAVRLTTSALSVESRA